MVHGSCYIIGLFSQNSFFSLACFLYSFRVYVYVGVRSGGENLFFTVAMHAFSARTDTMNQANVKKKC